MSKIRNYYVADDVLGAFGVTEVIVNNKVYTVPNIDDELQGVESLTVGLEARPDADWYESVIDAMVDEVTVTHTDAKGDGAQELLGYEYITDAETGVVTDRVAILSEPVVTTTTYVAPVFPVLPGATFRWNHSNGDVQATCVKCKATTVFRIPMDQGTWVASVLAHTYKHPRDARSKYRGQPA